MDSNERVEFTFNVKMFMSDIRMKSGAQTLREIEAQTGISASTLSRLDNGKWPDIETLMIVCGKLQMEPGNYFDKQVWVLKK
jgi:transcriptional regulator with XRE-family HTH domain